MKKICFCNSNIAWGGGEKWHLEAALHFASKGYAVHFFCHPQGALLQRVVAEEKKLFEKLCRKDKTCEGELLIHPVAVGSLSFLNPFMTGKIYSFFAQNKIDAVIMNLPADLKFFAPIAKKAGVSNILFRRGSAIAVKDSMLNRWLYGAVISGVIANSAETAKLILQNNPDILKGKPLYVIPNGIDVTEFTLALEQAGEMQNLPAHFPSKNKPELASICPPLILGNAGRLNRQKGQYLLLHLGVELQKLGKNFYIIIAGAGELEEELRAQAKAMNLEKKVYFCGFMENLAPFWKSIDIFVLSSLWEGFGYVLLEAMLAKKAICAFNTSNIPELVRTGYNGLLFDLPNLETPDMHEMAKSIAALSLQEIDNMGKNGYEFASQNFSQQSSMEKLEKILFGE